MGKAGYLSVRKRDAAGRWPAAEVSSPRRAPGERPSRRHPRRGADKKRGLARNTRRGEAAGDSRHSRGRRGLTDRRERPVARRAPPGRSAPESPARVAAGTIAPEFEAFDEQGHPHRPSAYRGRPLLLLFLRPGPAFGRRAWAARAAASRRDLFMLGVGAGAPGEWARLREAERLPFPVVADRDGRIAAAYGIAEGAVLVGADGRVRSVLKRSTVPAHLLERLRA